MTEDLDDDEERAQQIIEHELNEVVGKYFERSESMGTIAQALINVTCDFAEGAAASPHEAGMLLQGIAEEARQRLRLFVAVQEAQTAVKH